MFFRKLCRNAVFPTSSIEREDSEGIHREQPSVSPGGATVTAEVATALRTQTASLSRVSTTSQRQHSLSAAAGVHLGNRVNHLPQSEHREAQGRHLRPLTPPPSYRSHRYPSDSIANQYEYAASSSSYESNATATREVSINGRRDCPDLLHACSLIIPGQRERRSSSNENLYRRSISLISSSSDYAEIDDFCEAFSRLNCNEKDTVKQENQQQRGCVTNSVEQAMGQNLSLRRPRISLTWVLRDQQQSNSTNSPTDTKNQNERKKFKSKNKEEKLFSEKYVSDHNLQEYQEKREPTKDLLFVCSPQKTLIETYNNNDFFERRNSEIRKNLEKKSMKTSESGFSKYENSNDDLKSLKGTYSEPSLVAASEGNQRRHRHRKRRDRNRVQKFGYEIRNVDEFLSKCSLSSPGNIPVVLSSSSTLYQTRPGGYQIEIPLPLGMVVNAVFKNQNWLYVQTPHAEEGYVGYSSCLPLGILPPAARAASTSKPPPCWETNGDVFPRPCGNMTDSEKEIRLRGGTRSDGARTPRLRRSSAKKTYGEHHVDKLYLRAASQPKLTEKSYAQLKPIVNYKPPLQQQESHELPALRQTDEYVVLQHKPTKPMQRLCTNHGPKTRSLRQTLVAITNDYVTESIAVHKGDIVTLLACRESKDRRQWFYVKSRDGREGFIPAEFAGHGFL